MQYKNIFEYLESKLSDNPNPTDKEIAALKRAYYKDWHKYYNRRRRKLRKEFTLGFREDTLKQIDAKRGALSVSEYLYQTVFNTLQQSQVPLYDQEVLNSIKKELLKTSNQLEELLENGASSDFEMLLERIENIELQFQKL